MAIKEIPSTFFRRKFSLSFFIFLVLRHLPFLRRFLWSGTVATRSQITPPSRVFHLGKSRLRPSGIVSHLLTRNVDNDPYATVHPFSFFRGPHPSAATRLEGRLDDIPLHRRFWQLTSILRFLAGSRADTPCSIRLALVVLSQRSLFCHSSWKSSSSPTFAPTFFSFTLTHDSLDLLR